MSNLIFDEGVANDLSPILDGFDEPVLVVTGDRSFAESGAEDRVVPQMAVRRWDRYVVRDRLPGFESVREGISDLGGSKPGVVVAIGGGAVIDTAKLIALAVNNEDLNHQTALSATLNDAVGIVAIPTTAGSGSERTPFAVAYEGTTKFSIAHPSLRPAYAMVDPTLTYSMSPELTASSGLDVLAHAIESAWAASATETSVELSFRALEMSWNSIRDAVGRPTPDSRRAMAEASTTAGAAIAIAKTTASHALSYYLTAVHGVPHGVAAAITLGQVLVFNAGVEEFDVSGPRSPIQIREVIGRICDVLGAVDAGSAKSALRLALRDLAVPATLADVGVTSGGQLAEMVDSVNAERLANNPRKPTSDDLWRIVEAIA